MVLYAEGRGLRSLENLSGGSRHSLAEGVHRLVGSRRDLPSLFGNGGGSQLVQFHLAAKVSSLRSLR